MNDTWSHQVQLAKRIGNQKLGPRRDRHPNTHIANSAADDRWRLYTWDVYAKCDACPSTIVAWVYREREYCNACAEKIRHVHDRLTEAAEL